MALAEVLADAGGVAARFGEGEEAPWASPSVAVRAAQDLLARSGADLALVLVGSMEPGGDPYTARQGITQVALATLEYVAWQTYPFGGTGELTQRWVGTRALDQVRRHLLAVLRSQGLQG